MEKGMILLITPSARAVECASALRESSSEPVEWVDSLPRALALLRKQVIESVQGPQLDRVVLLGIAQHLGVDLGNLIFAGLRQAVQEDPGVDADDETLVTLVEEW